MSTHRIITRNQWGGGPVRQTRRVASSAVQEFAIHYHDGRPQHRTGAAVPKFIEQMHRARGWSDIGYGFVIDTNGQVFEGRGWNVMGAHAGTGYGNRQVGVQLHIGGNQAPSPAMLNALVWLYRQARNRYGRWLRPTGHNDYSATSCPGPHKSSILAALRASQAGTGAPVTPTPKPQNALEKVIAMYKNREEFESAVFTKSKEGALSALWEPAIPERRGTGSRWGASTLDNTARAAHNTATIMSMLQQVAKNQGVTINTEELAAAIVEDLAGDVRAAVLEAGGNEATAQRAADIIGERVNAGAQGEVA